MIGATSVWWMVATVALVLAPFVLVLAMWRRIRSTKGTNALRFTRTVFVQAELPKTMEIVVAGLRSMSASIQYRDDEEGAVTGIFWGNYYLDSALHPHVEGGTEVHLRAWNAFEGYQGLGWDLGQAKRLVRRLVAEMEKASQVDATDPGHYGDTTATKRTA